LEGHRLTPSPDPRDRQEGLEEAIDRLAAETTFSGVVRVDDADGVVVARAYGEADRAHHIPNTLETQFGLASGGKGLTALAVVSLIEEGVLGWDTTARSVLGSDLPLIDDGVTVEHLLAHRSGIGDYLDEDLDQPVTDYVLSVPPHELADTEQYLAVLDGHPMAFEPGKRFAYSNGGFVVLALIAERAGGVPFHDLVRARVCEPAGMHDTAFLRSDELPGRAAIGYLTAAGDRTNVFHLPVRGSGDGGVYSTVADVRSLWNAFFDSRIVSEAAAAAMVRARSDVPSESKRYGLGFWLSASGSGVALEGYDAGVSFHSAHDPRTGLTHTVVSNTSEGAWPLARHLRDRFAPSSGADPASRQETAP
jgi:CubicO group peptidase (beta-lactamase class C family)